MNKKKLFIGSSSEELHLAKIAKSILDADFDVTIWNENVWDTSVFKLNQNFLSDLLKASLKFDFGILIGTNDDKVEVRGEIMLQPRDNVLFELGLFTGRLGTSKCAFLIDKEVKLLSDFKGITLAMFDKGVVGSFQKETKKIRDLFLKSSDEEINFFPSATLASVYYENLIVPICRHLIKNKGFNFKGVHYGNYKVNVIIPDKINDDVNLQFERLKCRIPSENETFQYEGRPRSVTVEAQIKDGILEIIDFPTIISGINHAISNLLPNDFNRLSPDYSSILDRELRRFIYTLKKMLIYNEFDEIVIVKRESELLL